MTNSASTAPAAEALLRERDRVVHRLRGLALDVVPVDQVRAAAQQLADLVADVVADADDGPRRTVPRLAPDAAGDQVTVLVGEVQAAATRLDEHRAGELVQQATAVLTRLRRDT